MVLSLIEPPAALPVTLVDAKNHLRVEHDDEDDLITGMVAQATEHVETRTGRKLISQRWRQHVPTLSRPKRVFIESSPVISVDEVRLIDSDGTEEIVSPATYELRRYCDPAVIVFSVAPTLVAGATTGLNVDLRLGYGETGNDVPGQLIRAILLLTAHWYEYRGVPSGFAQDGVVPEGIAKLLQPFRGVSL